MMMTYRVWGSKGSSSNNLRWFFGQLYYVTIIGDTIRIHVPIWLLATEHGVQDESADTWEGHLSCSPCARTLAALIITHVPGDVRTG